MSNEMISVERGLLERACAVRNTANGWALSADAIRELRALLAKPAEQPQGEPVAPIVIEVKDSCVYLLSSPLDPGQYRLYTRPAEQPAPGSALKAFANDMINAAFEGGSFDGGDIQDIAVRHGLLRIDQREGECGEVCACRSEGDGFPAECYRKTALLRGEQPAPVAVVLPEQWQTMETCPKHIDVLFYHERNGVTPGRLTDADSLMTDKERDDWDGDEDARFIIDAFGFGHWGVDRMDGSEAPTHWQPLPNPPQH